MDDLSNRYQKVPKAPGPLSPFNAMPGAYLKNVPIRVSNIIYNNGSWNLYKKNGFSVDWQYVKKSGEHEKDNGFIKYSAKKESSNLEQMLACFKVEGGIANEFIVFKRRFAEEIKNRICLCTAR